MRETRCREYREGRIGRYRNYRCRTCGEKFRVFALNSLPEESRLCSDCRRKEENVKTAIVETRVEAWPIGLIDDNPFNPRLFYKPPKVAEKAESIRQVGLLQKPKGRVKDGRVQLAFGGYRRRAFVKLNKDDPKKWEAMPVEVEDLSDDMMIVFALEENLKRDDNTPIEVARAIESYFAHFQDATETKLAKKLNMTQGNVSNMRRVLTLSKKVLEKIDEGRISFTMGRELLILKGLNAGFFMEWSKKESQNVRKEKDEEYLMLSAIKQIRGPESADRYGSMEPPTVDGIRKAIASVVQSNFKHLDKDDRYSYYQDKPLFDSREAGCLKCPKMVLTHPTKSSTAHYCTDEKCWEKHQKKHQDRVAAEAVAKRQADLQRIAAEEAAKIKEPPAPISQEIPEAPLERIPSSKREFEEKKRCAERIRRMDPADPCKVCMKCMTCEGTPRRMGEDNKMFCEQQVTKASLGKKLKEAKVDIPGELKGALEIAGTRGQVIDLHGLWGDNYSHETITGGYARLDSILDQIQEPKECTEGCIKGFHYAFDSSDREPRTYQICSDKKCLAQKKAAFTRNRNAKNNTKKNAERAAFKEAVEATVEIDRPRMKLILYAQIHGNHVERSSYSQNNQLTWLANRLKIEVKGDRSNLEAEIWKKIRALSDQEMARLIVNFLLNMLTYQAPSYGFYGSNREHQDYKVQTTEVLNWMSVGVNVPKES